MYMCMRVGVCAYVRMCMCGSGGDANAPKGRSADARQNSGACIQNLILLWSRYP